MGHFDPSFLRDNTDIQNAFSDYDVSALFDIIEILSREPAKACVEIGDGVSGGSWSTCK